MTLWRTSSRSHADLCTVWLTGHGQSCVCGGQVTTGCRNRHVQKDRSRAMAHKRLARNDLLHDRSEGPWIVKRPQPVQVTEGVSKTQQVTCSKNSTVLKTHTSTHPWRYIHACTEKDTLGLTVGSPHELQGTDVRERGGTLRFCQVSLCKNLKALQPFLAVCPDKALRPAFPIGVCASATKQSRVLQRIIVPLFP